MYFFGTSNGFPAIAIQVFPLRGLLFLTTFDLDNDDDEDDENATVVDAILMILFLL